MPIIVDFWAPWCEPCKQLGPILEKVVQAAAVRVRMVKINIDENQALAQQLRIQSIPMVYAFKNGQPADGFQGALPESQIKAFVERLAGPIGPAPTEIGIEQAKEALNAGQLDVAADIFQQVLAEEPANPEAIAGLARAEIALGRSTAARERLGRGAERACQPCRHRRRQGGAQPCRGGRHAARSRRARFNRLEADGKDHAARLDLATAMFLRGQTEEAMEQLLHVIKTDRDWQDQAARKQLLKFFDALGPAHPATVAGRRQLSAVLFS